ncbi:MAG: BON domain-containing protein, partial [Gammaproteobacteria bacterium]
DVDASNLKIKESHQPFTDMLITAKIKGLFIKEKVFGDRDIAALNLSVETKNGVVYLTGIVDNQEQLQNALRLIRSVKGVKKVEYHVKQVTPVNGNQPST